MRRVREKRRVSIFKVSILVLAICSILTYSKISLQNEVATKQTEVKKLQAKVKKLQEEQEELKKDSKLTDKEIEKIARERLGMAYEDEIIFQSDNE